MKTEITPPKKPFIFYYLIVLLVILLINFLLIPQISQQQITQASYSDFLNMISSGAVKQVQIENNLITFSAEVGGQARIFQTGMMDDPNLIALLYNSGIEFTRVIPQEASPFISFLLSWILPLVLAVAIGQLLMRQFTKNMGGAGAMSFGKSNAKVYVAAQTGKTFADVAGAEEAKAALKVSADRREAAQGRSARGPARNRQNSACTGCGGGGERAVLLDLRL